MDSNVYVDILENTMLPYASWEMPLKWTFQHDNDPKHRSKHAKAWFASQEIDVMTCGRMLESCIYCKTNKQNSAVVGG